MAYSKGSVVVAGDQAAYDRLAGLVVVPDRGGQGEDPLRHPGDHPGQVGPAMPLQVQLTFERVVDELDDLVQRLEELAAASELALADRAQKAQPGLSQGSLEVAAVVLLLADQHLAEQQAGHPGIIQDGQQHLPPASVGAAYREARWHALQRAQQLQPQPPGPLRAGGAGAVLDSTLSASCGSCRNLGRRLTTATAAEVSQGRL
jgi:hypothetical protein